MRSCWPLVCLALLARFAGAQASDSVASMCGAQYRPGLGVVTGVVREARDRTPSPDANVTAAWAELTVTADGLQRSIARRSATTTADGRFVICDVPGLGIIALTAGRGGDSTDLIELQMPDEGVLRRDLYVGSASGGSLSGIVVSAVANRSLAGVQVSVSGRAPTRTNDRGEWVLANVPSGTRILEVRAVSYNAERRVVDVMPGAAPIRTTLSTMRAVLDTMRIKAARLNDPWASGFEERRRSSGTGKFLTAEDIARRGRVNTSDILMTVPGLQVDGHGELRTISMDNALHDRCTPAIYIDGYLMSGILLDDIEAERIMGIEVYAGVTMPPQFRPLMFDRTEYPCGSIVIWTRPLMAQRGGRSWKARALIILGAVAFAVVVNAIIEQR